MNEAAKTKKRQSRYKPELKRNPRVDIQERDLEIIEAVIKEQFLTTDQISRLFFGSYSTAKIRLRKLWNQGYLTRQFAPVSFGSSPAIYCPTKKGVELLVEERGIERDEIDWRPSKNRVRADKKRHELDVNEFKVALITATRDNPQVELLFCEKGPDYWDYVMDPSPGKGEMKANIPLRPDRFFGLMVDGRLNYFFLEVDRSTMQLKRFKRKLRGYRRYYYSGGFVKKYGEEGAKREDYPFRVLTTAPTEERRNNLVEQAIQEKDYLLCWFGVFDEVVKDQLGKVWVRGKEYKEIIDRLPLDERQRILGMHKKTERDKIIRERILRHSVLE